MTSLSSTHSNIWSPGAQQCCYTKRFSGIRRQVTGASNPHRATSSSCCDLVYGTPCYTYRGRSHQAVCSSLLSNNEPEEPQDESLKEESLELEDQGAISGSFRDDLENIIGMDDSKFNGEDLAALIRNKYGRSYDVQLIKKEFLGRNLLAMNVMWKYREQRSFPLTEEEYILRLDDVANNLKCWGAVSHIRNSLAKLKERPRIGKAVSIFIDMDETGARSNEWIYK